MGWLLWIGSPLVTVISVLLLKKWLDPYLKARKERKWRLQGENIQSFITQLQNVSSPKGVPNNQNIYGKTMVALARTHDIRAIEPLSKGLKALRGDQERIRKYRKYAVSALTRLCTQVYTVVFGQKGMNVLERTHVLCDPDVSELTNPLYNIRRVVINAVSCNPYNVKTFANYMKQYLHQPYLKEHVTVDIYGNLDKFQLAVLNPFTLCKKVDIAVETILFGDVASKTCNPLTTLTNPDMSGLVVPMTRLREVCIETTACDIRQVGAFTNYMITYLGEPYLKQYVTVNIYGSLENFRLAALNPLIYCKHVEIERDIENIVFGAIPSQQYHRLTTLSNPDVSDVTFPLSHITQVMIHTATYDFHLIERFLTYAINSIGQKHLKKEVVVHIYGNPENLHPNLRNSLTNLCKSVVVHEEEGKFSPISA